MAKARATKALRETGWAIAKARRLPKLSRAHLLYLVHPGLGRGRLDPGNWYPSVKALLDGLVDAGVLPDDSHQYVIGPDPRVGERCKVPGGRITLLLVELPLRCA